MSKVVQSACCATPSASSVVGKQVSFSSERHLSPRANWSDGACTCEALLILQAVLLQQVRAHHARAIDGTCSRPPRGALQAVTSAALVSARPPVRVREGSARGPQRARGGGSGAGTRGAPAAAGAAEAGASVALHSCTELRSGCGCPAVFLDGACVVVSPALSTVASFSLSLPRSPSLCLSRPLSEQHASETGDAEPETATKGRAG